MTLDRPLSPGERVRQVAIRWDIDRGPHGGVLLELSADTAHVRWDAHPEVPLPPERVPADSIAREVVHILRHGGPLCEFMPGFPSDWPPGHVWTRVTDCEVASCEACTAALHARLKEITLQEAANLARDMGLPEDEARRRLDKLAHKLAGMQLGGKQKEPSHD